MLLYVYYVFGKSLNILFEYLTGRKCLLSLSRCLAQFIPDNKKALLTGWYMSDVFLKRLHLNHTFYFCSPRLFLYVSFKKSQLVFLAILIKISNIITWLRITASTFTVWCGLCYDFTGLNTSLVTKWLLAICWMQRT